MSCILYSKASYDALACSPLFWRVLWLKDWAGREMVSYIEEQHAAMAA